VRRSWSRNAVRAAVLAGRVDQLAAAARRAPGVAERRFLLDALERAISLADPGAIGDRELALARQLGVDEALLQPDPYTAPPHAVRVPLVVTSLETDGRGETEAHGQLGFARLLYVSFRPAGDARGGELRLDDAARRAVSQAIDLAARQSGRADVAGFDLVVAQPAALVDVRIEGPSIGAAAFVSALSLFSGRAARPGLAITGCLAGGRVTRVGSVGDKVEGVLRGRSDVRRIVVPKDELRRARQAVREVGADVEVSGVATVSELTAACLSDQVSRSVSSQGTVDALRLDFRAGWEGWRWPALRERLARAAGEIPPHRPDLAVEVLAMLGAVERNLGAPEESHAVLDRARNILADPDAYESVPDLPLAILFQHLALTEVQLCRFAPAVSAARQAVEVARRGRLRSQLFRALGCMGIVALARGRPEEAVSHHTEALSIAERVEPETAPRTRTYLLEALGAAGDIAAARALFNETRPLLRATPSEERRASYEAWLRVAWASCLVRAGEQASAVRVLDAAPVREAIAQQPLPGLFARRWLGVALAAGRRAEEGFELLAMSPAAYGLMRAPRVRFLSHLNVLVEAQARLARSAWNRDIAARACTAIGALPRYGAAPTFLGEPARAVAEALVDADLDRDREALDATARDLDELVARCVRLG